MGEKIFEPIEINGMKIKNRIGMAPMLSMPDVLATFSITENTIKWFEKRAKGGVGLIMTGTFSPMFLDIPNFLDKISELAERIHRHGATLGIQIGDGGIWFGQGPSPMPYPDEKDPKLSASQYFTGNISPMSPDIKDVVALPVEEIEKKVDLFADSALKLKKAGVDCVELHCAHGGATLHGTFISPFLNRREDEYGGNWENRLRFPTNTIKKMRASVGPDFPLFVRFSADELLGDQGITLEDTTKFIVPAMEAAGVDCFDISQGSLSHSPEGIPIPLYYKHGCFINLAEAVKKVTRLPVIGVGRIVEMKMANRFIEEGKADIIYMARQLTADPDTPNKYFEGRSDEIRKCIGCIEGCGAPCAINYDIASDALPLEKSDTVKKVLIIGGGVAGMEAARVCALRGHQVVLMEKEAKLGGTVSSLSLDPLLMEFGNIVEYLGVQMKKLKIDVRVCREVGPSDIDEINPDAVIIATGASLIMPDVAKGKPGVMDHIEALKNRADVGDKVVVWGLMYGAELAVSLAAGGKEVVLVGEGDEKSMVGHTAEGRKWWILRKLIDMNVVRGTEHAARLENCEVSLKAKVKDITSGNIHIETEEGDLKQIGFDTLIISRGRQKEDSLFDKLQGKTAEIYKIGDCATPGNIQKAVRSANEIARKI